MNTKEEKLGDRASRVVELIDNQSGNTMLAAVRTALQKGPVQARIATAFLSPSGLGLIASALESVPEVRLLIGSDPASGAEEWRRTAEEQPKNFARSALEASRKRQLADLRQEYNRLPFTKEKRLGLLTLARILSEGNIEIRRYEEKFLHAKAYILSPGQGVSIGAHPVIVGSSNLTSAGLLSNLELSLGCSDKATAGRAVAWFDDLWVRARPFELAAVLTAMLDPCTPYMIFLRVLYELYAHEAEEDKKMSQELHLTEFQKHGVLRARRLIETCGGAIVSDEVGLGKTFIAGEIIAQYQKKRQRALVICPAALINTWGKFKSEQIQFIETISYEKLANDEQLNSALADTRPYLERDIGEYQLVVVDEAHNYRNPKAPMRARILRKLLYGNKKDLLLLTATPVNNSLWDLYHLISYFIRQDAFFTDSGIQSLRKRFEKAEGMKFGELSPDELYPIVDATTVKRTRDFIIKHYPNERIKFPDGKELQIVFPQPHAITVKYDLDDLMPGIFEKIAKYLNPESDLRILFARYLTDEYRREKRHSEEAHEISMRGTGFLWSGMVKRFESSSKAFSITLDKMIEQHTIFLGFLDKGLVVSSKFLQEYSPSDDGDELEVLQDSDECEPARLFRVGDMRKAVKSDLLKLRDMRSDLEKLLPKEDPKLAELLLALKSIVQQAKDVSATEEEEIDNRKVLIFSTYANTVQWIYGFLCDAIEFENGCTEGLSCYKDRIGMVYGGGDGLHGNRDAAAQRFAPRTAGKHDDICYDILVTTDVLAEGVNLQQARHIINFDMPWNPMRLVQRHGRIDRLLSEHKHVYLRTFFPEGRLDAFLGLDYKIRSKIARAAATVGVVSPIESAASGDQVFTETREELIQLEAENASIFERGGTKSAIQSGEEYRQTLRQALKRGYESIADLPWKSGSGMLRGQEQGILFCAKIETRQADRTYLCFVNADADWKPIMDDDGNPHIEDELGRCLRICECAENEATHLPDAATEAAFDLWSHARDHVHRKWTWETDPANLQPKVRKLNLEVADHIRNNFPLDAKQERIRRALAIVQAPWSRTDETSLRKVYHESNLTGKQLTEALVDFILQTGLEPLQIPTSLPPIDKDRIDLLVWMAISAEQD